MPNVKVPYPEAGLAAFEELDTYEAGLLISGSWPVLSPGYPLAIAAGTELEKFHVCGLNNDGEVVPAVKGSVQASLISTQAAIGSAGGTTTAPFWYSGCFNPEMLIWDASYVSAADKATAFNGAPSPTQIVIRARG